MKIKSVDIIQLKSGNSGSNRGTWCPVIVKINTDDGIYGYGEAGLAYGKGWRGAFGMCLDFAETIIGEDPFDIERIHESLFRNTFWGLGGGTIVNAAMSAIDIALFDIKGKALNVPVYQLLGGKTNDDLRVYASQLQYGWGADNKGCALLEPKEYGEIIHVVQDEGYDAIKVDPLAVPAKGIDWQFRGYLSNSILNEVYSRVAAMREAGGKDMDIIIELHANSDTMSAIQIANALEDLNIMYIEEPVHPLNPELMKQVKNKTNISIAAGERIYSRFGYLPFFQNRSLDVIQPDVCLCGGISETKKVCDMAYIYDCNVQIHVCGSPISKAAALQVEATIPNFIIHEHHQRALNVESRKSCVYDYQPINGRYKIPEKPGIGQELTKESLKNSIIKSVYNSKIYSFS